MGSKIKILFVEDEKPLQTLFCRTFKNDPYLIITADNGLDALKKIKEFDPAIVITDINMPKMNGFELLEKIITFHPRIDVICITGFGSIQDGVNAIKNGAQDYLVKPIDFNALRTKICKITGHTTPLDRDQFKGKERRQKNRFENIIGQDAKMLKMFQRIIDVSHSNTPVLITGETGTGKELVVEAIHHRSPRKTGPLIKVNCAAMTEQLINSELFGHEKGAFTGAIKQKKGHFELANNGTIFLDEIGDVPLTIQISLLRVLEQGTFYRVGGHETQDVDFRFVCATNKNLQTEISKGNFREDLFYRINVVPVQMPSLRQRKSDIPLLAHYFLGRYCDVLDKNITSISSAAMNLLMQHDWPGNVRELRNVIEYAVVFCRGHEIIPGNLTDLLLDVEQTKEMMLTLPSSSLADTESTLINKMLVENNWNLAQAAIALDIARGTLYGKMKKYGIQKPVVYGPVKT